MQRFWRLEIRETGNEDWYGGGTMSVGCDGDYFGVSSSSL
jgi:hypothetical protein